MGNMVLAAASYTKAITSLKSVLLTLAYNILSDEDANTVNQILQIDVY